MANQEHLKILEKIGEQELVDADNGIDSTREVRESFVPDFSNWKGRDSYQKELQRLVRDRKTDEADPVTGH